MGEKRNAYRVFLGKPEGNRPLARLTRRWKDNINLKLNNTDLKKKIGGEGMDWINLA
jgi:hypothetical protein